MVCFTYTPNTAATSGGLVTVSGLNFLTVDATPSAELGYNPCSTAAWVAKTSLVCSVDVGRNVGPAFDVVLTASAAVGSRTAAFSFDCNWGKGGGFP